MKFYAIRHQQSKDNLNGIIQGPDHNSSLTRKGEEESRRIAQILYDASSKENVSQIVSSPLERAAQTAQIIGKKLCVPVTYDSSLVEFDSGILAGPKKQAEQKYPEYMKIWHQRGDLDGIPGAELGVRLQARSIYFLERYFDADEDLIDIVVSHAGFNRSMVNTARGKPRTLPIGYQQDALHFVRNPWQNIDVKKLVLAKTSEAYRISTPDQIYVMKRIHGAAENEMKFQYKISEHVAKDGELLSQVLFWGMREDHAVQVLKYLEGKHVFKALTDTQRNEVFAATCELGKRLEAFPASNEKNYVCTLKEKIESCLESIEESPIKLMGRKLLSSPTYKYLIEELPHVPVHYDLNRCNILFTSNNDVKFLDLGSIAYAPSQFLPASLFMSFFMLKEKENFSLDTLISSWPNRLNKKNIAVLMQARALIGGCFFQQRLSDKNLTPDDQKLYQKYLKAMKQIENIIEGDKK